MSRSAQFLLTTSAVVSGVFVAGFLLASLGRGTWGEMPRTLARNVTEGFGAF